VFRHVSVSGAAVALAAAGAVSLSVGVRDASGAIPAYSLVGSFDIPSGASSFDLLPDGRVLALVGSELRAQGTVNGSAFAKVGSVNSALINQFGASFLRISPSGARIAIGDGNAGAAASVVLLNAGDLSPAAPSPTASIATPNFDAAWSGDSTLFVSGAVFGVDSVLNRLDTAALTSRTVVAGIGDGSGGVAIRGGRLFTGVGFDLSPGDGPETGDIRAFDLSSLSSAGTPINFATGGMDVGRLLSAASLGFDPDGALLVGGGDFAGESGFAAAVDPAAVNAALAGGPGVSGAQSLHLEPQGPQYYEIKFNNITSEVLVRAYGFDTVFRYAVPAPGCGLGLVTGLIWAGWRKRDA